MNYAFGIRGILLENKLKIVRDTTDKSFLRHRRPREGRQVDVSLLLETILTGNSLSPHPFLF